MAHVVVDPVTRIEGHLRVEVTVDENTGKVEKAMSSGTAWRGIEVVTKGRDPRDAWAFVGRICGVCTSTHSLACLRSVEDALGITIPKNANYIRNIMNAVQDVHDHIVHFYHLHALDWVSPVEALAADPVATAQLQNTILDTYNVAGLNMAPEGGIRSAAYPHEFPKSSTAYFAAVQDKVRTIVESGQLGIFANNWWDHPDYKLLPPEVHLMAVAHYLNVLDRQSDIVIPHVIFGGKNPHPHYVVGGMPCSISMDDMNAPVNSARLAEVDTALNMTADLVNFFYAPDILAVGQIYAAAGRVDGGGLSKIRCLSYGNYPDEPPTGVQNGDFFQKNIVRSHGVVEDFEKGVMNAKYTEITGEDLMNPDIFAEEVEHSWYEYEGDKNALNPREGQSSPHYTAGSGYETLEGMDKYSWVKSPIFKGSPCEVGPLPKYIITYTKIKQGIITEPTWAEQMMVAQIETVSSLLGVEPHVWMPSTLGRTACRALDAQVAANIARYFFDKLIANIKAGDTAVANTEKWDPNSWPKETVAGVGLLDAPRGGLGHWCVIENGKIKNYQAIVPSTWNACPINTKGEHGAYELCMMDTHVEIPEKPLEIVKAIRSFDPCLACATHLYNLEGEEVAQSFFA